MDNGIGYIPCKFQDDLTSKPFKLDVADTDYMKVPRRVAAIQIRQCTSQISRKLTYLSETRFAPLLAISIALVMSEFESEHIRKS